MPQVFTQNEDDYRELEKLLGAALEGNPRKMQELALRLDNVTDCLIRARFAGQFSEAEIDDLTQEVLTKLFRANMKALRDIENPRALIKWMGTTTTRRCLDGLRRKQREQGLFRSLDESVSNAEGKETPLHELVPGSDPSPREEFINSAQREMLKKAMHEALSERERIFMELHCLGYTVSQIAIMQQVTPNTVSIAKHRAQKKLLAYVVAQDEDESNRLRKCSTDGLEASHAV